METEVNLKQNWKNYVQIVEKSKKHRIIFVNCVS